MAGINMTPADITKRYGDRIGDLGGMTARLRTFIIGLRPATRLMISSCRVVTALALITRAPPYLPPC